MPGVAACIWASCEAKASHARTYMYVEQALNASPSTSPSTSPSSSWYRLMLLQITGQPQQQQP